MPAGEKQQSRQRPDDCSRHVFLRVPRITLRSQESIRSRSRSHGNLPFQQLIGSTHRQADTQYDEKQPAALQNNFLPYQCLAGHQCRNKALGEMPNAVIVISRQVKMVSDPIKQRDLSVGVMPTYKQNAGMQRDEQIDKRGELKSGIGDSQRRQSENRGEYFQYPREVVM